MSIPEDVERASCWQRLPELGLHSALQELQESVKQAEQRVASENAAVAAEKQRAGGLRKELAAERAATAAANTAARCA